MVDGAAQAADEKRAGFVGMVAAAALLAAMAIAIWMAARHAQSMRRFDAPTPEQLALYQVVLQAWLEDHPGPVNLVSRIVPFDARQLSNQACLSAHGFDATVTERRIRLRGDDLAAIGLKGMTLLNQDSAMISLLPGTSKSDRSRQPAGNLPSSYITLSDVVFDRQHQHAVVALGYSCADNCGLGKVMVLEQAQGTWRVADQCMQWIE